MMKYRYKLVVILAVILLNFNLLACSANVDAPEVLPLKVHFIDVGQADAILIMGPKDQNIMIDAGNNADSDSVVTYLQNQGVRNLKAVIGTHPHEDHIGGLDAVIRSFTVESVYMPKVSNNTETFRDVLLAVQAKGLKVTTAAKGVAIPLEGISAAFLGPVGASYKDLNDYSAVLKLDYGSTGFLFQGDAEAAVESELLNSDLAAKLQSDVIKVGHHGSSSSTTMDYLEKVQPKYAVIMVGKDNVYNHPHKETIERLNSRNILFYRTDLNGTIIATSDGKTVTFDVKPVSNAAGDGVAQTPVDPVEEQFVDAKGNGLIKGNLSSSGEKIYHMPGGAYYDMTIPESWFKTESEAQAAGFRKAKR